MIVAFPVRAQVRLDVERPAMGSVFRIVACVSDSVSGIRAIEAAFARIGRLDSVLSDYDPGSEVSRLAATYRPGTATRVSADLAFALDAAALWSARTGGAYDPALGSITRPWRRAMRRGEAPDEAALDEGRAAAGWRHVTWDASRGEITFDVPGVRLDFGGIGKGLAADAALRVMRDRGIHRAIVDAGGDVVAGLPPPGAPGWIVALPEESGGGRFWLADAAVATSGDRYRHLVIGGSRVSHILDPDTGYGLRESPTVTVLAADGSTADALATTASIAGPDVARAFARAVIVTADDGRTVVHGSAPEPVPSDERPTDCAPRPGRVD